MKVLHNLDFSCCANCIGSNPLFRTTVGNDCLDYRGVLISGVDLYYKGTFYSVLITGVSSL